MNKLSSLPKIKSDTFRYKGNIIYSGTIIRKRIEQSVNLLWHYAIIYGFDVTGNIILVENNTEGIQWKYYNQELNWDFYYLQNNKQKIELIKKRVLAKQFKNYAILNYNCEQFVNDCVFGKPKSIQSEISKNIINLALTCYEVQLLNSEFANTRNLLSVANQFRNALEIPRNSLDLNNLINNRITKVENQINL